MLCRHFRHVFLRLWFRLWFRLFAFRRVRHRLFASGIGHVVLRHIDIFMRFFAIIAFSFAKQHLQPVELLSYCRKHIFRSVGATIVGEEQKSLEFVSLGNHFSYVGFHN